MQNVEAGKWLASAGIYLYQVKGESVECAACSPTEMMLKLVS